MFVSVMKLAPQYDIQAVKCHYTMLTHCETSEYGLRLEGTFAASGHSVAQ